MVEYICRRYAGLCDTLLVGTAETGTDFYRRLGFEASHVVPGFFTDNYAGPVVDGGVLCVDMIYLKRMLSA